MSDDETVAWYSDDSNQGSGFEVCGFGRVRAARVEWWWDDLRVHRRLHRRPFRGNARTITLQSTMFEPQLRADSLSVTALRRASATLVLIRILSTALPHSRAFPVPAPGHIMKRTHHNLTTMISNHFVPLEESLAVSGGISSGWLKEFAVPSGLFRASSRRGACR